MEKLFSIKQAQQTDLATQKDYLVDPLVLMEQAGLKCYLKLKEFKDLNKEKTLFIGGGGNNGGDILVMAREAFLEGYKEINVVIVASKFSDSCLHQLNILKKFNVEVTVSETINEKITNLINSSTLIVEGLSGTGLKGEVREPLASLITLINSSDSFVVSIDLPSGSKDLIVKADLTITIGVKKAIAYDPLTNHYWGDIHLVKIPFAPTLIEQQKEVATLYGEDDLELFKFEPNVYKNKKGHLALFGGSKNYLGAVRLASKSAFHSRVGLVTLFSDQQIVSSFSDQSPSTIIHPLKENEVVEFTELTKYQAIACGMGWGEKKEEQLLQLLKTDLPIIIDADGITSLLNLHLEKRVDLQKRGKLILTPHAGEFNKILKLLGFDNQNESFDIFVEKLTKVAKELNATVVYKSSVVWISEPDGTCSTVEGKNDALGVAGSGDVLSGIIGSLLAQGYSTYLAALYGNLIHQKGGKIAKDDLGYFDSDDLITYIGKVCRKAQR